MTRLDNCQTYLFNSVTYFPPVFGPANLDLNSALQKTVTFSNLQVIVLNHKSFKVIQFFRRGRKNLKDKKIYFQATAEFVSKIITTIVNLFGIVGLIVGLIKTRQLIFLEPGKKLNTVEMDMDLTLLKLTSFFYFLYMIFTIITGTFKEHETEFPDRLIVIYGCVGILQICLQIAFIQNLKQKAGR